MLPTSAIMCLLPTFTIIKIAQHDIVHLILRIPTYKALTQQVDIMHDLNELCVAFRWGTAAAMYMYMCTRNQAFFVTAWEILGRVYSTHDHVKIQMLIMHFLNEWSYSLLAWTAIIVEG